MQRPKSLIFSIILKQKSEKIPASNTIPEPLKKENFRQPFVFRDKFIFLDNVFQIFTFSHGHKLFYIFYYAETKHKE